MRRCAVASLRPAALVIGGILLVLMAYATERLSPTATAQGGTASVRLVHGAAGVSDAQVTLAVGGDQTDLSLSFGEVSPWFTVPAGRVVAQFSPTGYPGDRAFGLDLALAVDADQRITVVLYQPGTALLTATSERDFDPSRATAGFVNTLAVGERRAATLSAAGHDLTFAGYSGAGWTQLAPGYYELSAATWDAPDIPLAATSLDAAPGGDYLILLTGDDRYGIPVTLLVLESAPPDAPPTRSLGLTPSPASATPTPASSPSPMATPAPSASPSPTATARPPDTPGSVILAEAFGDPATGAMPATPEPTARLLYGYIDGEYYLRNFGPTQSVPVLLDAPDATIAVDVRLLGDTTQRTVSVGCRFRSTPLGNYGYRLRVEPARGVYRLVREDGARDFFLRRDRPSSAIRPGNASNRLEITCSDTTITAAINGTIVATAQDSTYRAGSLTIGVGARGEPVLVTEARFDNLVVIRR